ncbi:ribbon-helix-helix protein, CopG family [Archangium violaceum]|uniref:ribbon-helix-helix domain-containing protein n=1 Tax=Archangium violaceum TaxID=83451 RepID=UPI00193AF2CC|nr:ribbon-helix-helix domain-containing protein [Archangium violaceum]QRK07470.1 ribbon-helix-helix protein, CopG family [Archangium violaceum]
MPRTTRVKQKKQQAAATRKRSPSRKAASASRAPATPPAARREANAAPAESATAETTPPTKRGRFAGMSVAELQAKYREVVGRPTGSTHPAYLQWKIREAEAGRIPVGPRPQREVKPSATGKRVIPLSFDEKALEALDKAWRNAGMPSRTHFFRRAVRHYLTEMGATEAAAFFASDAE